MPDPRQGRYPGSDRGVLVLRVLVLVPALATLLVVAATVLQVRGGAEEAAAGPALELGAPVGSRELPEPVFGAPLPDVHGVAAAVEVPGGWAVLDHRAQQIVLLNEAGGLLARFARRGGGPGELEGAAKLVLVDSLLAVADGAGHRLDLFTLAGAFVDRLPLPSPGCDSAPVRVMEAETAAVLLLRVCSAREGSASARVERVHLDGRRATLAERELAAPGTRYDPSRIPMLALAGGRAYFAITPSAACRCWRRRRASRRVCAIRIPIRCSSPTPCWPRCGPWRRR